MTEPIPFIGAFESAYMPAHDKDVTDTTEHAVRWRDDLKLLDAMHRDLLDAVSGVADADLDRPPAGSKFTLADLIQDVAFHDIYHAGQIQLLKRLQGISRKTKEPA